MTVDRDYFKEDNFPSFSNSSQISLRFPKNHFRENGDKFKENVFLKIVPAVVQIEQKNSQVIRAEYGLTWVILYVTMNDITKNKKISST